MDSDDEIEARFACAYCDCNRSNACDSVCVVQMGDGRQIDFTFFFFSFFRKSEKKCAWPFVNYHIFAELCVPTRWCDMGEHARASSETRLRFVPNGIWYLAANISLRSSVWHCRGCCYLKYANGNFVDELTTMTALLSRENKLQCDCVGQFEITRKWFSIKIYWPLPFDNNFNFNNLLFWFVGNLSITVQSVHNSLLINWMATATAAAVATKSRRLYSVQ